jgi:nucleoside-diphosphate-sugar epimerase
MRQLLLLTLLMLLGSAPIVLLAMSVPYTARSLVVVGAGSPTHASIGLQLTARLSKPRCFNHDVTLLIQNGDLAAHGIRDDVKVRRFEKDAFDFRGAFGADDPPFDFIFDFFSSNPEHRCERSLVEYAERFLPKKYIYVGKADVYSGPLACPLAEDHDVCAREAVLVERHLAERGLPLYAFRVPKYMYGPKLPHKAGVFDFFFDKMARGRIIPVPRPGTQLASIVHIEDVVSAVCLPVSHPAGEPGVYNCGPPQVYSYEQIATMCSAAEHRFPSSRKPKLLFCDGDLATKHGFPFHAEENCVLPTKAMEEFAWSGGVHDLAHDLPFCWRDYVKRRLSAKCNAKAVHLESSAVSSRSI